MSGPSSRMLTLLTLLQSRRDWPGPLLAGRLDISERTVRRDVDRLRELGYRIRAIKGPDGGYRLDAGSELPPLLFDDDQAIALAVALQSMAVPGSGFEEASLRALTTVRQVMPSRLRHRMDAVRVTPVSASSPTEVDGETLVAIGEAIRASEIVRFDYAGVLRQAEPHHLIVRAGRWYLVAWDLDRHDWRIYRVDRMALRSHTGGRFDPRELPGGDPVGFVGARFKGSTEADTWPCQGEVILDLPADRVIPYAGDWTVRPIDGSRCRVLAGAWSWAGLAALLGRFDADIEVIGPPELAAAFGALARRYSAAAGAPAVRPS